MEIRMAKPLSTPIPNYEPRQSQGSDGLFVTGIWSVIAITLGTFIVSLLL
jgi:hypothetical protein